MPQYGNIGCAVGVAVLLSLSAAPVAAQIVPLDADQCRRYTSEIRVGAGASDSIGRLCRQEDGTWRKEPLPAPSPEDGVSVQGDVRFYGGQVTQERQSDVHVYSTHPDAPVELVVEDNIPAYIVVDPYRYYHDRYKRGWSDEKRNFNRHHRGPGWQKHWQHHQKVLNKE